MTTDAKLAALKEANRVRKERARLRERANPILVAQVFAEMPDWAETYMASDLLDLIPRIGRKRAQGFLFSCGVPDGRLRDLQEHQRTSISLALRERYESEAAT